MGTSKTAGDFYGLFKCLCHRGRKGRGDGGGIVLTDQLTRPTYHHIDRLIGKTLFLSRGNAASCFTVLG